jgi:hypothetical protein
MIKVLNLQIFPLVSLSSIQLPPSARCLRQGRDLVLFGHGMVEILAMVEIGHWWRKSFRGKNDDRARPPQGVSLHTEFSYLILFQAVVDFRWGISGG